MKNTLPAWTEPTDLEQAKLKILSLGKSLHEHAYLIGKALQWVKAELGHGNFGTWVEDNLWFSERSAQRFMKFAEACARSGMLLDYHPRKNDTVSDLSEQVIPDPERLMKLAHAYEILEQLKNDPGPELVEARAGEQEGARLRAEMVELQQIDLSAVSSPSDLKQIHDRASKLESEAYCLKVKSLYKLGKILNSIPSENLNDFLCLVNLPDVQREELFVERIADLI